MKPVSAPSYEAHLNKRPPVNISGRLLKWCGIILITTVWTSALLFGLYILTFYASALYEGNMERWNKVLPRLYQPASKSATTGIGMHFIAGGVILMLGSIQLIDSVRVRFPSLHRWIGRVYILASVVAAIGGCVFIIINGTIGGTLMDVGFGLYGVLMFTAALLTYRHAVARRFEAHRAWALRLYALAIGSWLYRMDYGFWLLLTNGLGHADNFSGPFDGLMAFFFYIPNLIVAEIFIRARQYNAHPALRYGAAAVLLLATGFLLLGTYYFTLYYWGPAIIDWAKR